MPRKFIEYLEGQNIYVCRQCGIHLTTLSELISQSFRGQSGTAYLFNTAVNVRQGQVEQKKLTSGIHFVCDIFCIKCDKTLPIGWKYIQAVDEDQKYKEGKYILEVQYIKKQNWVDD